MKFNIILSLCIIFLSAKISAQNCTNELLLQTPGILKADAPYNSGTFSGSGAIAPIIAAGGPPRKTFTGSF